MSERDERHDALPGSGGRDMEPAPMFDTPWEVLARYGRGDAPESDVAALHEWADADESRLALLRGVGQLGALSRRVPGGGRVDAAWTRLRGEITPPDDVAAVLHLDATPASEARGTSEARPRWRRIALGSGMAAAALALAFLTIDRWHGSGAPTRWQEIAAPQGQRIMRRLPDGSQAMLEPESRIRYAVGGGTRVRTVYLEGAAYFKVAHDVVHPFVVHGLGGEAQAVGTAFGIRTDPADSALEVIVAEGRVALRSDGARMGSGTMLEPGQRGVWHDGLVRVEPNVDVQRELGWVHGQLAYDLVPLATVLDDVTRWSGVRVTLSDPSLANVRVTVVLPADSVDLALRRLAAVLETEYRRSGAEARLGP